MTTNRVLAAAGPYNLVQGVSGECYVHDTTNDLCSAPLHHTETRRILARPHLMTLWSCEYPEEG